MGGTAIKLDVGNLDRYEGSLINKAVLELTVAEEFESELYPSLEYTVLHKDDPQAPVFVEDFSEILFSAFAANEF